MVENSPQKRNEKINKSTLNKYCLNEIDNNLKYIQFCLDESKADKNADNSLGKILDSCQTIEDLAMIYGYQGIENLAANINAAVTSIVKGERHVSEIFINKLGIAVQGIRSMTGVDDDNLVKSIVSSTISKIVNSDSQASAVEMKTASTKNSIHVNRESKPEKSTPKKDEPRSVFKIQEANTIQTLIDLIEKNRKKEDPQTDENQIDLSAEQLNNGEIEKVFNTIFVEETQENLKFLREALDAINSNSAPGEAIMRIKEACSSLKDSAASFSIIDVRDTFEKLHRITNRHLNFNSPPSSQVIGLIQDATNLLSDYLQNQDINLDPINQKLKHFLTKNNAVSNNTDHLHKQEVETIKVIDELQTFPKPKTKKKVKVKFNDDDVNVRWISKFK